MKKLRFITAIATLAACASIPLSTGSPKNPVERPVHMKGYGTYVVDLADGAFQLSGAGNSAHAGAFTNEGFGNFYTGELQGVLTAANGDEIEWVATGPDTLIITGGTGGSKAALAP